jgi:crotonobetainyl-CoA:carnitine CoA-transferase CaiB-like acyl-CoA transferase
MVLTVDQPTGTMRILGFPVKLSETPAELQRPAPKLGEHTREILARIGFAEKEAEEFKRKGAV